MECPKCKSNSVYTQNGQKVCGIRDCFYMDWHPISFDNDIRHFDGEKSPQDRYTNLYSNVLGNGGIAVEKEMNFDKQLKKGQKLVEDLCHLLKLTHHKIISVAVARFISILKLKTKGALEKRETYENDKDAPENGATEEKEKHSRKFSIKNLAAYSVYSACFQNELFFEDYNIAHWLQVDRKVWKNMIKEISMAVKDFIDFIPDEKIWHYVLRVCKKRKIRFAEQRAMQKLCEKIAEAGLKDGHSPKTVAACVFWKICEYSEKYHSHMKVNDICRKHVDLYKESDNEIQKYFDCISETVKKFFNDKLEKDFEKKYLPDWEGRISSKKM